MRSVLAAYRAHALDQPNRYRLATSGRLRRDLLPECLEEWAGQPFFFAAGDPYRSQALWSFAHGMVILEIDGRYPDDSDLDGTWEAGAAAFDRAPSGGCQRRVQDCGGGGSSSIARALLLATAGAVVAGTDQAALTVCPFRLGRNDGCSSTTLKPLTLLPNQIWPVRGRSADGWSTSRGCGSRPHPTGGL